ncbi:carbon-nitrogen hydrolase family protein [Corynebacterium sanguinis]|uniref:carbon-nitrogen hydrolase family protein n=1 Tax=Corynebacterium TaxID=1716 RepID=UPI0010A9ADBC|nr:MULTISPECIES: carbon-nitrogen hydrolase family protein [Corynebacterium]MCT1411597.1 carbon-nitrogen hydrolase family protein [Corynebacterium sanguinis]MCT1425032.1 carbon-nitrogen hydrolase family protein [Corynebacterium sanguinis]MCT1498812.1 carbon-nitrogen hydrolase family protein [Corynebacterium sanguinis]MCT1585264.1 carbon-nitrogen hydrolase family protein [Corynebacterium sanguinis]MCT1596916.1 carbon-nitrogen hydrolase family protein [Corynebacterium sanguinis]
MKIALLQVTTGPDKGENLTNVSVGIREAAANGATLIVTPEATSQGFDQGRLDTQAEELDGPFSTGLRELAEELGVTIVAGMFRPADEMDGLNRVYNTALITGDGVHKGYDKIHTFDVADYTESATVKPGGELVTFVHEGAVVGVATCFDIRYPEQFKNLARLGAEVIVVPTSWADGKNKREQWRTLTVARALDTGVFIVAADQARPGGEAHAGQASGPTGIGHSVVVAPNGQRIAEAGYGPEIVYADIDIAAVAEARASLPLLHHAS